MREGGGVASGKEEYYSFNHGNIHVVSLESYGYEPGQGTTIFDTTTGAQIKWLRLDLAAAKTNPAIVWVIVFTHYPPYSKGTHDSDTDPDLINIRKQLVRVLDQYKVDLLITGHSHVYERSKLMKNYLGLSTEFNPAIHNAPPANNEPTPNYYYKSQQASVNRRCYVHCGWYRRGQWKGAPRLVIRTMQWIFRLIRVGRCTWKLMVLNLMESSLATMAS